MAEERQDSGDATERYVEHPPGFILPPGREVDCGCDVALERPVLRDPTGWNNRITACMRCGKVSLIEAIVDEPRPHDVQCVGNRIEAVTADVLAWLSAWPRLAWGVWQEDRQIYLPASLRCASIDELQSREREFLARQRNVPVAERLLSVGIPHEPPPVGLPERMQTFAQTQLGAMLGPDADLQTLLSHARRGDWAMPFAYEQLKNRADFTPVVVSLLGSGDPARREIGISLVQHGRLTDPEIVQAVIELLTHASLNPQDQRWLHTLLDTLYYIGNAAAGARPLLLEIAQKIGDSDYYLRKRVEEVRALIK